jgi:hypothetical protein
MSKQGKQPQAIGRALGKAVAPVVNNKTPFKPAVKPNAIGQINMRQGMLNSANAKAHSTGVAMQNAAINGTMKQLNTAMNNAVSADAAANRAQNNMNAAVKGQPMPRQGGVTMGQKPLRMAPQQGPKPQAPLTAKSAGPLMGSAPKVGPKAGTPVKGGVSRKIGPY